MSLRPFIQSSKLT
jgi:hypothetical protein